VRSWEGEKVGKWKAGKWKVGKWKAEDRKKKLIADSSKLEDSGFGSRNAEVGRGKRT